MLRNLIPLARSKVLNALTYLLRDDFTTAESAPLTSPRTCEPGPGTLTISDTANQLSIASSELSKIAVSPFSPTIVYDTQSRSRLAGLSFAVNSNYQGGGSNAVLDFRNNLFSSNDRLYLGYPSFFGVFGGYYTPKKKIVYVLTSFGCYQIFDGTLVFVTRLTSPNATGNFTVATTNDVFQMAWVRVYQMFAPFDTDYGIATNRIASPAVNETTTSEVNALIEQTWTAVTGETWEFMTRRTDDNNCWIVRCSQGGSTIKLIEKNVGVETERSSAAQTWTNGTQYRLVVIQDGNTIRTYVANVAKNTYTSATFNNTQTGVKTNRAGTNLVTYPRTLSGAALTELQRWTS